MRLTNAAAVFVLWTSASVCDAKTLQLYLPEHEWVLQLTAAGFEPNGLELSQDGTQASLSAAGAGKSLARFNLSAYVEVVADAKDAAACRSFYLARYEEHEKRNAGVMKTTQRKLGGTSTLARSEYFIETFRGATVHQKHVNAFLRRGDACIDVHVSATGFAAQDGRRIEAILKSIKFVKPSGSKAPWAAHMISGAALAGRRDMDGALREYRAARAAASSDRAATPTDFAMIDKGLGEVYLALNDGKRADGPLRSAAKTLADDPSVLFNLACSSSMLGKMADAERALKACLTAAKPRGRLQHYVQAALSDPQLAAFRSSPEFQVMLRQAAAGL
ncbi:MAG: hypothetical protein HY059_09345 [Proteobacteria bacterium]|nr:hypothetical protein [Pseudomonadota bacterium]